ncbi:MAG: hypothetical protein ACE366_18265 [Bradymonadia bacterium]
MKANAPDVADSDTASNTDRGTDKASTRPVMRRLYTLMLALCLSTPVALTFTGCGDDGGSAGSAQPKRGKKKKKKKKKKKRKRGKKKSDPTAGLNLPSGYAYRDWSRKSGLELQETRDPFRIFVEELKPPEDPVKPLPEGIVLEGALSRHELEKYSLKAIITATALPKAMVTDPNGEGHIVRVGDIIGKERPYRLIRIKRNELVFKSLQPDAEGNLVITSRSLWSEEEAGELFR